VTAVTVATKGILYGPPVVRHGESLMKRSTSTLLVAVLLGAGPYAKADLSYSYLQGAWTVTEVGTSMGKFDAAGPELSGSYEVLRFLHVFASYRLVELEDVSLETELLTAGAGLNWDLSDHQSVFFNLAGVDAQADLISGGGRIGVDDTGYFYSIGFRESNNDRLEFSVSADHIEFDDSDSSDTSISMSLQYRITPRFRFEGGVNFLGEDSYWKVGVRYYLPNRFDRRISE
jgi:hypothetical protein